MSRKTGKLARRGGRLAGGPGYHLFAGGSREDLHAPHLAERRHVLAHRLLIGGVHDEVESVAAVNDALKPQGGQALVGLVCVRPGQRVRAGAVLESAGRSLRSGRPEMMGKPA